MSYSNHISRSAFSAVLAVSLSASAFSLSACPASAADTGGDSVDMYRLYNPYTGEHLYTEKESERDSLASIGWRDEGIGWVAPRESKTPVYRLYNSYVPGGDHHYTTDKTERDAMVLAGWKYEGVGWYSDDLQRVPVYRQFNPYAVSGTHNYTTDKSENDALASSGWRAEGVGWYALEAGTPAPSPNPTPDENFVTGTVVNGRFCKKAQIGMKGYDKYGRVLLCQAHPGLTTPQWTLVASN
ncbi:peptidase [Bifidobacterium sp. DSM 109957]|uniref:Peptidase n=2 Tax=Bifidobacterium oedipodis TaxID=2675322 RepID=A0A7Y0HSC0_9BIFI|nr:peptidase [Bifidobacterium sp. DSM 109957]